MAKWENYVFRGSLAGNSSWPPSSSSPITDLNDADNQTNYVSPTSSYSGASNPTVGEGQNVGQNGQKYGFRGSGMTGTNATAGAAGQDPLCGGFATLSSSAHYFQAGVTPGVYDFRAALGSSASANVATAFALFDGDKDQITAAYGISSWRLWAIGKNITSGWFMVSTIDRSVWRANNTGVTGSTEPSGGTAGSTFSDNTVTWTRQAFDALIIMVGTPSGTSRVVDQNTVDPTNAGTCPLASAWRLGGSPSALKQITVTGALGNSITAFKCDDRPMLPRVISLRPQAAILTGSKLIDKWGDDLTTTPVMYCNEMPGFPIARIATVNGAYSLSAFSLSGNRASYFSLAIYQGAVWLMQSARVPDALAGAGVVEVTQDSPGDTGTVGSTYKTTFNCTFVSSQGKPTDGSDMSFMPTQQWLERLTCKAVHDSYLWNGWQGETIPPGNVQTVTSGAGLRAAIAALPSSSSNTEWYAIYCEDGVYDGYHTAAIRKDLGSGGVIIRPAPGHDPEISCGWINYAIRGFDFGHFKIIPDKAKIGDANNMFRFQDPGSSSPFFTRVKFHSNRIGLMWSDDYDPGMIGGTCVGMVLLVEHAESALVKDNNWHGNKGHSSLAGCYAFLWDGNWFRKSGINDLHNHTAALRYNSTTGVFPTLATHGWMRNEVSWDKLDYFELDVLGLHPDFDQVQTGDPSARWQANTSLTKPPGPATFAIGTLFLNNNVGRVYRLMTKTGDAYTGAAPGPSTTGTGIIDNQVTWDYVGEYISAVPTYMVVEDCMLHARSILSEAADTSGYNAFIDSNANRNCPVYWSFYNCTFANPLQRGIGVGDGRLWVYRCNLTPGSQLNSQMAVGIGEMSTIIRVQDNCTIFDCMNVYAQAPSGTAGKFGSFGSKVANFMASATVGTRPPDLMRGVFSTGQGANGIWGYPTLPDDENVTAAEMVSNLSSTLHLIDGSAGARHRERHVEAAAGSTITIVVAP